MSTDQILKDAAARSGGWHSLRVTLPKSTDKLITVIVDFADGNRPDKKMDIVFDRISGTVHGVKTFSSYNLGERLRMLMHMVHTGEAAGVLGQTIIGLAGLSCCVLVWTGTSLFIRRIRSGWKLS